MVRNVLDYDEFLQEISINEGLLKTYPIDTVVKYIQKKFKLTGEHIGILHDGGDYIAVSHTLDDYLLDKIDHILIASGYYQGGNDEDDIIYEKKFDDEVFDKLQSENEIKYLYHVSPSINDDKILQQGLIPKSKNYMFNYPERVYLLSDKDVENPEKPDFIKNICQTLFKPIYSNLMKQVLKKSIARETVNRKRINEYSVFRIDFSKIKDIKLYMDPNVRGFDSYYTMDNIRPEWIEKVDEIKL